MNDHLITRTEFQRLMDIIGDLTIKSRCGNCLKGLVSGIGELVPCDAVFIHYDNNDSEDQRSWCVEFTNRAIPSDLSADVKQVSFRIDELSRHFAVMDYYQAAYRWRYRSDSSSPDISNPELAGFLRQHRFDEGIAASLSSPLSDKADHRTLIKLVSSHRHLQAKHLLFVDCIVQYVHNFMSREHGANMPAGLKKDLTTREKEVLQWIVEGKTSWEVAMILSMSERTVKYHLNNIYSKMDVINRTQAVVKANVLGLI